MIYKGTSYTERITMSPMDRTYSTQWIELRKDARASRLEVFLCDDHGNSKNVWSWSFDISDPMTYEQIKFNIMEGMFRCDTMQEYADFLEELFSDGFEFELIKD